MRRKILFLATVIIALIFTLIGCDTTKEHTHNFSERTIVEKATCTEAGLQKSICSCGISREEAIPETGHNFIENICTNCSVHFHDTDVYRYNQLKPYADKIAIYLSKTYITNTLEKNSEDEIPTIEFLNTKILERDFYWGYVTEINYNVVKDDNTKIEKEKTLILKIEKDLLPHCAISEVIEHTLNHKMSYLKDRLNWGVKTEDFSYDFYETLLSPQKASLYEILRNPEKYQNKYVEITGFQCLIYEDKSRESITIGNASNASSGLELIYGTGICDVTEILESYKSNVDKTTGYISMYSDSDQPFMYLFYIEQK